MGLSLSRAVLQVPGTELCSGSLVLLLGWELGTTFPRDWTGTVVSTSDKLVLQLNMINYMWIICLKLTVFTSEVLGLGALVHIIIFHFQHFPQGLNLRTGMQKTCGHFLF